MANTSYENAFSLEQKLSYALKTAIFIPFKGISLDMNTESTSPITATTPHILTSLDPASKLEKILEILPQQQDVVRNKMIEIILDHIEEVKLKAKKKLEQIKISQQQEDQFDVSYLKEDPREKDRERLERIEMDEMFRRIRTPSRPNKSYELQKNTCFTENFQRLPQKPIRENSGEVSPLTSFSTPTIRQVEDQLAKDMQILVQYGIKELEKYDEHCRSVLQPYESSLARRTGGTRATTTNSKSTPIINSISSQNLNLGPGPRLGGSNEVGRLSNGMPVSMERHPARKTESLGELTRRTNK